MYSDLLLLVCLITALSAQSTGTLRMFRNDISQSWYSGIVQIYSGSSWGNICDDYSFGSTEADVICHQLGYTGASLYSNTGTVTIFGTDYSSTIANDVLCSSSSYLTITQCSFSTIISSLCYYDSLDVTVSCYSTRIWSLPITGDIRLTGGAYSNQGLLEVYCNGQWGTVCDDDFDSTHAQVACRQLGYNFYDGYGHLSIKGKSYQPIYLRYLSGCAWSDNCLTECGGCPSSGISGCSHSEDITLQCGYYSSLLNVYSTTLNTCKYYAFSSNSRSLDHSESGHISSAGVIIGIVIGSIIFVIAVTVLIATALICIRVRKTRSSTRPVPYTRVIAPPTTTGPLIIKEEIASQQPDHLAEPTTVSVTPPQPLPPPYDDELQPLSA